MPISSRNSRWAVSSGSTPFNFPAGSSTSASPAHPPLGSLERLDAVQFAGGQLQERLLADGLAWLADEPDPLAVPRQHYDCARMLDDLALHHLAVVVAELLHLHGADVALPDLLFVHLLEAHPSPPRSVRASAAPPARPARK